jgi:hypothetical protein
LRELVVEHEIGHGKQLLALLLKTAEGRRPCGRRATTLD